MTGTKTYAYNAGGYAFLVTLPSGVDAGALLPSFIPFLYADKDDSPIFTFLASSGTPPMAEETLLESGLDDMGFTRVYRTPEGYRFRLSYGYGQPVHTMDTDCSFSKCRAFVSPSDKYLPHVVSSFLRIAYSQSVLLHGGISIHASAVSTDSGAAIFMGKSGTGKSTHARLWGEAFADCILINDDNPLLRLEEGRVTVWGTPWSGKTKCWKNISSVLRGGVRLRQAGTNRFEPSTGGEALGVLLPGCSVLRQDRELYSALFRTLSGIIPHIRCGYLYCRPDMDAALLCRKSLLPEGTQ